MEPLLGLGISLPPRGSRERLSALHRQLRAAIVDGRLHAGLRLPSTRRLAQALRMARNTAVAAYDLLLSEGAVTTRPGGGTFVAQVRTGPRSRAAVAAAEQERRLAAPWRNKGELQPGRDRTRIEFDFSLGLPDKSEFPFTVWRRLSARALRSLSKAPAAYGEAAGRAALRNAIAEHVSFARAVACDGDDVVVTSGAQQAFDLLARILVTPGKTRVAVEDPGYPPLQRAFVAAGARVVGVPVDNEGIVVERLPGNVRVVCVTPSHQFPLGVSLSVRRRLALLAFARRNGAVIVEDDYDGEFRYSGPPLDALQTLDRDALVFYVGTLSKSLFPALRLGYVVTPAWARNALVAAKQLTDWHAAVLAQDTLAPFIAEGHLARHVRKMRSIYARRHATLLQALAAHGAQRLEAMHATAGLHVAVQLHVRPAPLVLAARAAEIGIRLHAVDGFAIDHPPPKAILFGFGVIPAERIDAGVQRLCAMLR